MSWARLRALPLLLGLAGCGFHPLYVDDPAHPDLKGRLARVHVEQMHERTGQLLTNRLRDAFNPRGIGLAPSYNLVVDPHVSTFDALVQPDSTYARTNSLIQATWKLVRLADGQTVTSGSTNIRVGHDVTTNDYANVVATETEIDRGLAEVSLDIQNRVTDWLQANS